MSERFNTLYNLKNNSAIQFTTDSAIEIDHENIMNYPIRI